MTNDITDYRDIFLNDRPMMDTRAPVEFLKCAFPGVVNLPLMTDIERQRVGTCYKQQGQQAAIVLVIGSASCGERVCQSVCVSWVAVSLKKKQAEKNSNFTITDGYDM